MKTKLLIIYLAMGAALAIFGLASWYMSNRKNDQPTSAEYLDNLNIKTDNPQPVGKNITPVSP